MPRSTKANADRNRQRLFDEARRQFAQRGFHGTSIASIAGAVGLTKQTLLHHFGSKERLFSEVLQDLARTLAERVAELEARALPPGERLATFLLEMLDQETGDELQLVIRELLENRERAPAVDYWHLKAHLDSLVKMVRADPVHEALTDAEAFALLYHALGAISYFKISQPTLRGMLGDRQYARVKRSFRRYLAQALGQAGAN